MWDDFLRIAPIVLVITAVGLAVILTFAEMFRAPKSVRNRRTRRDGQRLSAELSRVSAGQTDLLVHWDRYRHLSKFEIFAAVERSGFIFVDQELNETGWALNFTRA